MHAAPDVPPKDAVCIIRVAAGPRFSWHVLYRCGSVNVYGFACYDGRNTMKRRRYVKRKSSRNPLFVLFSSLLLVSLTIHSLLLYTQVSRPLVPLAIPDVPELYLPGTLEFPDMSESVLGAQPVDPNDIIKYVNIEREKVGAPPLRLTPTLAKAAQMRAETILKHQNFSHSDPYEHIELGTVMPKTGYQFSWASENIGMGGSSGEDFVGGFMNSYYHKMTLLDPKLVDTGVAVVSGPYKQYYVNIAVQLFAIPSGHDEYLGYTKQQKEAYAKELKSLNGKLNPLGRYLNRLAGNPDYTEDAYAKFRRQREILTSVYELMEKDEPLKSEHALLIAEYNALLP